jgi:uncharacterized membrane protein YkvA (DUF1232 family)
MNFSIQSVYNWYRGLLKNPKYRWWIVLGSIVYIVSPIDISPDFIPFIGQVDDGIVIALLVTEVSQVVKEKLQERNLRNANKVPTNSVEIDAVEVKN